MVELSKVLFIADGEKTLVGKPMVDGARVIASCTAEGKADKVIAFKYHNKNRYRRKIGHRAQYTELKVEKILLPGEEYVPAKPAPQAAAETAPAVEADEPKPKRTRKKVEAVKAPVVETKPKRTDRKTAPKVKATKSPAAEAKPKRTVKKTTPKAKATKPPAAEAKPKRTREKADTKSEEKHGS